MREVRTFCDYCGVQLFAGESVDVTMTLVHPAGADTRSFLACQPCALPLRPHKVVDAQPPAGEPAGGAPIS